MANIVDDIAAEACCKVLHARPSLLNVHIGYIKRAVESVIIDHDRRREVLLDPSTRSLDGDAFDLRSTLCSAEDTVSDAMFGMEGEERSRLCERVRDLVSDLKFKSLDESQKELLAGWLRKLDGLGGVVMSREELAGYLCVAIRTIDEWKLNGCVRDLGHPFRVLFCMPENVRRLVRNRGKPRLVLSVALSAL